MTPQEYNDIKVLITRKEWRVYLEFLNSEIKKLNDSILVCKNRDEAWDLRNKILGVEFTVSVAEQAIDEFEQKRMEKTNEK